MTFPGRLKIVIKKTGLKRDEFYARVGVSKSQLFNYLGGRSEPTLSFFQRLKLEFPWVDLDWLTAGSAGSYTISNDDIPLVATPTVGLRSPVAVKIDLILVGMNEDAQRDVLKYAEEKKLLAELKAEKQRKAS